MTIPDSLTCTIVTTALKNVVEQSYNAVPISDRSNIKSIACLIHNLRSLGSFSRFIICHDFKVDSQRSIAYHKALINYCNSNGIELVVSPSSIAMPSQVSATMAFRKAISCVKTSHIAFWEHDWLFEYPLDLELVSNVFEILKADILYMFCPIPRKEILSIDNIGFFNNLLQDTELINVCRFSTYNNTPFIARTSYLLALWSDINFSIPSWNGGFGGFIEGPVSQRLLERQLELPPEAFHNAHKHFVIYDEVRGPLVKHFGTYTPQYLWDRSFILTPLRLFRYLLAQLKILIRPKNV